MHTVCGCRETVGNALLKDNPDISAKIETAIRQNSGLIAEKILAGEESEDEDAAE